MTPILPTFVLCAGCGLTRAVKPTPKGEPRTPHGWKKQGASTWCAACWAKKYILRAITIPAASPLDCSWDELRAALKTMWAQTTNASNWMMTELYARDVRRGVPRTGETMAADGDKMPPMPRVYLYPDARRLFPALPSQAVASLEQSVQRKYRAARYKVVWTAAASLPTHRYPTPFPVSAQGWYALIEEDRAVVSVRIGAARWRIRLKGGPQFRRQFAAFRQIAVGEAVAGELAIYDRDGIMVKMAAWLPREEVRDTRRHILSVRTSADCLLVAVNAKDETLWRYNADHLRRWIAEHRTQLHRWAEDQKYEHRPVPPFAERRERATRKFRNRMDSALHAIAEQLAEYAARRRFASVMYDDSERGYLGDGFQWAKLGSLIAEKLDRRGIALEFASGGPERETPSSLTEAGEVEKE